MVAWVRDIEGSKMKFLGHFCLWSPWILDYEEAEQKQIVICENFTLVLSLRV